MKIYTLKFSQVLKTDIHEAWDFFSNPKNLIKITPPHLNFKIGSDVSDEMYPGMIITYKVHPFLKIPLNWITEITHVKKPEFFVDEQRFGPYKFWHHQHKLKEVENGVEVIDLLNYVLPFGILGNLINYTVVSKQLDEIFSFRREILNTKYNMG